MGYLDLRQHLRNLEDHGLVWKIDRAINKDTEMHPLVRWQFRGGLPESERRAFIFTNVVDSRGRQYPSPATVGALASSAEIYALGMGTSLEGLNKRWEQAFRNPIPTVLVDQGCCQEEVHLGEELAREGGGLDEFPIPISTPGFDNSAYITCSHWISKDPETGGQNSGNYRAQIKATNKIALNPGAGTDIKVHWNKYRELGQPMPAAVVIGAPPVVSYATVQKVPYGVDELAVAGGLAGEPIRVVKCKTVDLVVPAEAEIVIEGWISTDYLEPEGPFGESHGYMNPRDLNPFMEITAITHRRDAIWVSFISQVTPSESSVIKRVGYEPMFLSYLRKDVGVKSVKRVFMHETLTNLRKVLVLQMSKPSESEVWRALFAAANFKRGVGKIVIAVDEDIDPQDLDAVFWAMSYRMKPHKDVQIINGREKGHGPPFPDVSEDVHMMVDSDNADDSAMLINAILFEPFPPVSLPKKEYMENALHIWEELGLPSLKPQSPWFGYSLGQWDEEMEEEAQLAVRGQYYQTGTKLAGRKVKV